jgi:pimeloyl-ACP methyl ester carboxylesterase
LAEHIHGPLVAEVTGGSGPPMLFVHPWPNDRTMWTYQVLHFSRWFRVITIDLPGFGRSPRATPGVEMVDYANACWEAVDDVSGEPAILVGLSVGSTIVKYMANLRPERTLALILTGGPFYADPDYPDVPGVKPFQHAAEELDRRGIAAHRELLERNFSPAFAESPIGQYFLDRFTDLDPILDVPSMVEMIRALIRPDPVWLHPGVHCPVLIVMGGLEKPRSQIAHHALHAHLPTSEFTVIPDAGHCCNVERPWDYDRVVLEFLRRRDLLPASD